MAPKGGGQIKIVMAKHTEVGVGGGWGPFEHNVSGSDGRVMVEGKDVLEDTSGGGRGQCGWVADFAGGW